MLTAHFDRHPDWFDLIVASNRFCDIPSDLGRALVGSIGIAPGANINPERIHHSMFEPVHGSAPDIAWKGIANPIGQIPSGAMMLEHFGRTRSSGVRVLQDTDAPRKADLGGRSNTREVMNAIVASV
jgi:tartrate dehydrogenase/decarboxylase/D-malate dehydrogenase